MNYHQSFITKTNRLLVPVSKTKSFLKLQNKSIRIFITVAALSLVALGSFYSPRPASSHVAKAPVQEINHPNEFVSLKPAFKNSLLAFQETIATFAADCTTPKNSFVLGETVCAQTDAVDLNFPGGRWVNWLRPNLSIAAGGSGETDITMNPQTFTFVPDTTGTWKVTIAETGDSSQTPAVFTVTGNPPIATYAAGCATPKDNFDVGDTICAKANNNFTGTRTVFWIDSEGGVIQTDSITPTSPSATRVATQAGNFRVYLSDGDTLLARTFYTVSDPANPTVDLSVLKYNQTGDLTSGNPASYQIVVTNNGPDAASSVELTDEVPAGLTYVSSSQDSGPTFTQTQTSPFTIWQIASLPAGETARFTITYTVDAGAGTEISNTATVTNTTDETHNEDNTSTTFDVVAPGGGVVQCVLDCPNNIVTTATTHGAGGGANVSFPSTSSSGTCGTVTTTPASGSFFPTGTTVVTSTSATGDGFCTFTVTVVDSAAPTISCPTNITVTANEGQGTAFVPDPNGSSSNVGTATVTGDQPLDLSESRSDGNALTDPYPLGTTDITRIVTDPTGRQATCTQRITVLPNHLLTISCPANVTVPSPTGCDPATGVNVGTATANSATATVTAQRSDGQTLTDPYPVGTTTIEWTATDVDTQVTSCSQTVTVTGSDTTPPILHVPANVTVSTSSCSVTLDDELGVATAEEPDCGTASISRTGIPQIACPTPGNPNKTCDSFVFPTGTTVITYTATNSSGLQTVGTQLVTVNEDPLLPPTISCPSNITLNLPLHSSDNSAAVTYTTPNGSDNCPGAITTRVAGLASGAQFPVGTTTNTYRVTDRMGNFTECSFNVTVLYNFSGFFQPVDNQPVVNVVNAGKAIPVKFSLSGNKGLNIFAPGSPSTVTINCDGTAPQSDIEETVNAGGSSLSYDAATDQYIYVWKTDKSWANTCRQLIVRLADGSEYRANFRFK